MVCYKSLQIYIYWLGNICLRGEIAYELFMRGSCNQRFSYISLSHFMIWSVSLSTNISFYSCSSAGTHTFIWFFQHFLKLLTCCQQVFAFSFCFIRTVLEILEKHWKALLEITRSFTDVSLLVIEFKLAINCQWQQNVEGNHTMIKCYPQMHLSAS